MVRLGSGRVSSQCWRSVGTISLGSSKIDVMQFPSYLCWLVVENLVTQHASCWSVGYAVVLWCCGRRVYHGFKGPGDRGEHRGHALKVLCVVCVSMFVVLLFLF